MENAMSVEAALRPTCGVSTYSFSVTAVETASSGGTFTVISVELFTVQETRPYASEATSVPRWRLDGTTKFVPVTVNVNAADGVVTEITLILVIVGAAAFARCAPFAKDVTRIPAVATIQRASARRFSDVGAAILISI
jgi:hypothetical protein